LALAKATAAGLHHVTTLLLDVIDVVAILTSIDCDGFP
jgi:hypothetical protein